MKLSFPLFGRPRSAGPPEWLIVGLGNPGQRYADNRHNVGFQVVDRLAAAGQLTFDERRNRTHLARGKLGEVNVAIAKPQTYMNLSGRAVGAIARFYKVPPERTLIIHDDLDLPLGVLRLREGGGAGGHHGIASIIDHLKARDFPRLRIGIGRPPGRMAAEAYVLQDFDADQKPTMELAYEQAVQAIHAAVGDAFQGAMNAFN
ncbi:MAG: aminoacyl-tRNA hydrolase [Ardenticatenia bacterium]|nr:aminoacyl-tRNA hydrolase [Ardenticatenia bacterium]